MKSDGVNPSAVAGASILHSKHKTRNTPVSAIACAGSMGDRRDTGVFFCTGFDECSLMRAAPAQREQ